MQSGRRPTISLVRVMIADLKELVKNLQKANTNDYNNNMFDKPMYDAIKSNLVNIEKEIGTVYPESEFANKEVYKVAELFDIRTIISYGEIDYIQLLIQFFRTNKISIKLFGPEISRNPDIDEGKEDDEEESEDDDDNARLKQINRHKKAEEQDEGASRMKCCLKLYTLLNEFKLYYEKATEEYKKVNDAVKKEMIKVDTEKNELNKNSTNYVKENWWEKGSTSPNKSAKKQLLLATTNKRMMEKDPLQWWRDNGRNWTLLSAIVRKVLAIPASSASPERIHSTAKDVLGKKRKRLRAELGGALTLSRMRARHHRNRSKTRPVQWMMLGEIVPIDAIKALGDWITDGDYDSDLEDNRFNGNVDDDDDNPTSVDDDDDDDDDDSPTIVDDDDDDDNNGGDDIPANIPATRTRRRTMRYNDFIL